MLKHCDGSRTHNNTTVMNPYPRILPSAEELKAILDYNPETGVFIWRKKMTRRAPAGTVAGTINAGGYRVIRIHGRLSFAHRIAWKMTYGEDAPVDIDHINGVPGDDRICNLRTASRSQNLMNSKKQENNTSGFKGVSWHEPMKKWVAYINKGGKRTIIGYSTDISKAANMRKSVEAIIFKEFSRQN